MEVGREVSKQIEKIIESQLDTFIHIQHKLMDSIFLFGKLILQFFIISAQFHHVQLILVIFLYFSPFIPKPLCPLVMGVNSSILRVLEKSLSRGSGCPQLTAEPGYWGGGSLHPQGSVSNPPHTHPRDCPVTLSCFSRSHFLLETYLYLCLTTVRMWFSSSLPYAVLLIERSTAGSTLSPTFSLRSWKASFGQKTSHSIFGGEVRLGSQFPQGVLTSSPPRSCSDLRVDEF